MRGYCTQAWDQKYRADSFARRNPRLKRDWTLDGGVELVETSGAYELVLAEWSYYSRYTESVCRWSSNQQEDYDSERRVAVSYLFWRLRSLRWIPVAEKEQGQRPVDLFSPGAISSSRRLSGWVFPVGADFPEEFVKALNIRRDWDQLTLVDWQRWLAGAENLKPQEHIEDREVIRKLYSCLLSNSRDNRPASLESSKLWWMERLPEREVWTLGTVEEARGAYLDRPEHEPLRLAGVVVCPARLDDKADKAEALFGMPKLSQRLNGTPRPSGEWPVSEMTQRIKNRTPYLIACLGKARNEQGQGKLRAALEKVDVTGVTTLKVAWDLDGVPLAEPEDLSFAHEAGGRWQLYLKTSGVPADYDPAWERLARVILLACGLSANEQASDVKDILTYAEEALLEKLTNLGVAPESIADAHSAAQDYHPRPIIEAPAIIPGAVIVPNDSPGLTPSDRTPDHPIRTSPILPSEPGTTSARSPNGVQRPHPETGLPAQEWLRGLLIKSLAHTRWEVSDGEVTVEDGGSRIDIRLQPLAGEPIYIEAKHTTGGTVYWSKLQIETAQKHPGRYFVALMRGSEENGFDVRWVFDPLTQFTDLPRSLNWTWKVRPGPGAMDSLWRPAEPPPEAAADSFKVVITSNPAFLEHIPLGIEALLERMNEAPQGTFAEDDSSDN